MSDSNPRTISRPTTSDQWRSELGINTPEVLEVLRKRGEVYIETSEDVAERERHAGHIRWEGRKNGMSVGVSAGWALGDQWTPKKKWDTKPEGSALYLRVVRHNY